MRYIIFLIAVSLVGCGLFGGDGTDDVEGDYVAYELSPERKVYTLSIEEDGFFEDGVTRLEGSAKRTVSDSLSEQADLLGSVANDVSIQFQHARDTLGFSGERTEGVIRGEFRNSEGQSEAVLELRPE